MLTKRRRRPGCFFAGLQVTGWLLLAAGLLLLGLGLVGFVVMLFRAGPGLIDALQHLDEQMAGFIFILILVNLAVFPVIGVVGAALTGLGAGLAYLATTPSAGPVAPA